MLSTGFPEFWGWIALALGAFATVVAFESVRQARKMANYCAQCSDYMHQNNIEALKDSKLGELVRDMAEVRDDLSSLQASHNRLRSKYSMRDLRERRKREQDDPNGELDLSSTTDKRALRLELRKKGLLK